MADQKRLIEIGIEGREPFRNWRRSDYAESLREGRRRLAAVEKYLPELSKAVDKMENVAVSLLQNLIRTQSVNSAPGGERKIAELVASELRRMKFSVSEIEPELGRISLVGNRRFGERDRPKVVFYGHLDTVPAGDPTNWSYPPFDAMLVDGKVIGRGAQDCKMGVASAIMAARILAEAGLDFSGTVCVATAADEESGGHKGIHELIQAGLLNGDYGVYIESIPGEIHIAHNGMIWLQVTTRGESAHSSKKQFFRNAIVSMAKIIQALDNLEFTGWSPHPLVPGGPYISINKIQGGTKENMIADSCTVTCDIRTMPGQTLASVLGDIENVLGRLRKEDPKLIVEVELLTYARSGEIPSSDPAVVFTQLAAEKITGTVPKAIGVTALTDQRWALYDAGLPMVIYSCGTPTWHMPNEHIFVKDYLNTIKILCLVALMHFYETDVVSTT